MDVKIEHEGRARNFSSAMAAERDHVERRPAVFRARSKQAAAGVGLPSCKPACLESNWRKGQKGTPCDRMATGRREWKFIRVPPTAFPTAPHLHHVVGCQAVLPCQEPKAAACDRIAAKDEPAEAVLI